MSNKAAWLKAAKARPLEVDDAAMPRPEPYQVVIKVQAVAINPVDSNIQKWNFMVQEYPAVIGFDMAGTVHAIGSDVKHVQVGDRVLACADLGSGGPTQKPFTHGTFQYYSITHHRLVAKIPDSTSYTDASVLPLALATAGTALFDKRCMGLALPKADSEPQNATLVVWGGASSVGSVAIMLALGAGYEVITTCSPKNSDYCRSLGAKAVFDYNSQSVIDDIVFYLENGKPSAGVFDAIITPETVLSCYEVAHRTKSGKTVGTVLPRSWKLPEPRPEDVDASLNYSTQCKDSGVGDAVYVKWVPSALSSGVLKCMPPARVIGQGLEKIQDGIDSWAAGVNAEKIVVEIPQ